MSRKACIEAHDDLHHIIVREINRFDLTLNELVTGKKERKTVMAYNVLRYQGWHEPGISAAEISTKLNIASSMASESVARGRRFVAKQGLKLLDEDIA